MDTFVDSSWYFFRYCSPAYSEGPFDVSAVRRWMPVDHYVGGSEHAILHLLYSRFFTKVLYDLGMIDFTEPFTRLRNQGQVILAGKAMSKTTGNLVELGEQIAEFGVDAVRLSMLFAGPPEDDIDWADVSPQGMTRFLTRAYRLAVSVAVAPGRRRGTGDVELRRTTHRTIAEVTALVESYRLNVAISRIMELVTAARRFPPADPATREAAETMAVFLSLFAPYMAEECWTALGHPPPVAKAGWPEADPTLLLQETVTCVIQIAGKVRARLEVPPNITSKELEELALSSEKVQNSLAGAPIRKVIVRPPKIVSIVTA